jgi:Protein of unknown function (DUF1670)
LVSSVDGSDEFSVHYRFVLPLTAVSYRLYVPMSCPSAKLVGAPFRLAIMGCDSFAKDTAVTSSSGRGYMGRSVTHKAIICYKSLVEKKPTSQVAQETFHSPEDVEHYVQCFRRIQLCRDKGLSPELIAQATGHSLALVQEYLDLIKEFRIPPLPDPERKEGSRSKKKRKQR